MTRPTTLGIDFGTTNSVVARARGDAVDLIPFAGPTGSDPVFRSALCFWQDEGARGGIDVAGGPWAIAEYLDYPEGSRFIQSFKSVAASASFEHSHVFERRYRFEQLGQMLLDQLSRHAGTSLSMPDQRVIVGRPVEYAGHRPDEALARARYDAMFAALRTQIHYVYEPLGAAYSYAARLDAPATVLVADFGGGTSDFSIVHIAAPDAALRCRPLAHAGVGIAGDRFDQRIVEHLVLPQLGKGGQYRSFDKLLDIPGGWFTDFSDWSRLALMRNRKTLAKLEKLRRAAIDPASIGRMIAIIDGELGYQLYDAVGALKRTLSTQAEAAFEFTGPGLNITADVTRAQFETWIAPDLARIEAAVDCALSHAALGPDAIDRVFLTGGTSLIPRVRQLFEARFGGERIATGGELTSIAHGLALIGQADDIAAWTN